jgi:hypothetical protein
MRRAWKRAIGFYRFDANLAFFSGLARVDEDQHVRLAG